MFPALYLLTAAPDPDLGFHPLQLKPRPMKTIYKFARSGPSTNATIAGLPRGEGKEKGRGKTGRRCFDYR